MFTTIYDGVPVTIEMYKTGMVKAVHINDYIIYVEHHCDEYGQKHPYKQFITMIRKDNTCDTLCDRCDTFRGDKTSWQESLDELLYWL